MVPMSPRTFRSHYDVDTPPPGTHLCYEVYDHRRTLIASGHLTNSDEDHAEEVFVGERFRESWRTCAIVWYISWSPCDHCMEMLTRTFLRVNPNVQLHIAFAKVYRLTSGGNIRALRRRGVNIRVMGMNDFYYCWNRFVDTDRSFVPWGNLIPNYYQASHWLNITLSGAP
ncbi:single-stranded DNA cytosine deaminase-like [Spea bombifrons]|uniref:single-stranded DNA cytosine deaminase-like n=1 Tax=Spea bombifrons TaxID=233779 RepID=UPI0023498B7A|nr:single-stranded DNA cytosine deaminase-like [Spea bombifrons]